MKYNWRLAVPNGRGEKRTDDGPALQVLSILGSRICFGVSDSSSFAFRFDFAFDAFLNVLDDDAQR